MSAKEMFEKLGYEYNYDDGFIEYEKQEKCEYSNKIHCRKISFDKSIVQQDMSIHEWYRDLETNKYISNEYDMSTFTRDELQAINQQVKELGWLDE